MPADGRGDRRARSEAVRRADEPERPHAGRPFLLATIHPATDEIRELAETLGMALVAEVYQGRDRPHPGTFFGKGKLQELRDAVSELKAGIAPAGWRWNGEHFEATPGDPSEGEPWDAGAADSEGPAGSADRATAWGGTPWVQRSETGRSRDDPVGRRDPSSAPGTGRRGAKGRGDGDEVGAVAPETSVGPGERVASGKEGRSRVSRPGGDDRAGVGGRLDLHALAKRDYLLVLNEDVRPAVLFNLEERLGIEVWDRTRLILEIFGQHAHVKEARLQVELAMLQYEIPLIHEAVHRRRTGERPGFMGGGEYEVADYEDFIKRRMRSVKDELERIRRERGVRRKVRRERFYLLSLAGYTNAGKSSLLNALTASEVREKWEMFSTLETTTRRMASTREILQRQGKGAAEESLQQKGAGSGSNEPSGAAPAEESSAQNTYTRPILLTDTVGFIQALPSWLLDAFRSTLEEISVSDVVLLVADVSDPVDVLLEKVRVCREELSFLDVTCPVILALSKADLVPPEAAVAKQRRLVQAGLARDDLTVLVSAKGSQGLADLDQEIHLVLPNLIGYRAELPSDGEGQRLLSHLYDWGEVRDVDYGERIVVRGVADPIHWKALLREGMDAGARITRA